MRVTGDVRQEFAEREQHLAEDRIVVELVDTPFKSQRWREAQTPSGICCDALDRRPSTVAVEARWAEAEHGAAEAADDRILTIDQLIDPELQRWWEECTKCRQSHRGGKDLLDDAVVQITCNPLAFGDEHVDTFIRCHHRTTPLRADAAGGFLAREEPTGRRP